MNKKNKMIENKKRNARSLSLALALIIGLVYSLFSLNYFTSSLLMLIGFYIIKEKLCKKEISKMTGILFLTFILMILTATNVFALGITPGRTTFDYEPGAEKKIDFSVVNSEQKEMNLVVYAQGELSEHISLSEVSFKMSASEGSKSLYYVLKMPTGLSPGAHSSDVIVMQLPEKSPTSDTFVGATIGVTSQILINVPFPGKYAEAELNVVGPDADGKIIFAIPVSSRGDLELVKVRATVDIYTSLNEKVATLNTNEVSIPTKQRKEIVATWDASKAAPGPYRVVATVLYDESVLTLEKHFNVGERRLNVEGIEVNDFTLGEIAKFEMLVESKWSESIEGVYAEMLVYNAEGAVMADFKSPTYDIEPLTKEMMIAFWDTAGVRKGTYDSSLFLRYGQSSEQQDFKLEVKDNEINIIGIGYVIKSTGKSEGSSSLVTILIVAVAVLVLVNLSWFLFLRKRLKKR